MYLVKFCFCVVYILMRFVNNILYRMVKGKMFWKVLQDIGDLLLSYSIKWGKLVSIFGRVS